MTKIAYNNIKNSKINNLPFYLNCEYNSRVFFREKDNSCFKIMLFKILILKFNRFIIICYQNLLNI